MTSGPDICPLDTPPSASWLHKSFLETALRTGDSAQTLRVTSFDVKPAVGKGDNYTSDLYRVKIHTTDGRVISLVVKKELTSDCEVARLMQKSTAFLRETHMYRSTAVKMSNILQDASPGWYRVCSVCHTFRVAVCATSSGLQCVPHLQGCSVCHTFRVAMCATPSGLQCLPHLQGCSLATSAKYTASIDCIGEGLEDPWQSSLGHSS
jgi:hypothetical protein